MSTTIPKTKTIGLLAREKIAQSLQEHFGQTQACFFIGFSKINAFALNTFRNDLKNSQAKLMVAKNTLINRALQDTGMKDYTSLLDQETGIVFVYDKDIVKPCKILVEFSKANENLKLKGGILENKKLTAQDLKDLAKLPNKQALLGTAVSAIASPMTGFLGALNQVILKFLWAVEEIKTKKQ